MKKTIRLCIGIDDKGLSGHWAVNVRISEESLPDWTLGLTLLKENLVQSVVFVTSDGSKKLEITQSASIGHAVAREKNGVITVELSVNQVEYIQAFFLKYFRDGVAEVDHLDLDVFHGSEETYFTIFVAKAAPALSPNEAKKKLFGR
jgi:hypothetical protein